MRAPANGCAHVCGLPPTSHDEGDKSHTYKAPTEDIVRLRRQSYLAYLFLNIVECPACHLPKAEGLICPCGVDG